MPRPDAPDPVRETLIAILRLLNQAEIRNEGDKPEQSLELGEVETRLGRDRPIGPGSISVSLAIGLLLRNGLVKASATGEYSYQKERAHRQRYQITAEGKKFLLESLETSQRIP